MKKYGILVLAVLLAAGFSARSLAAQRMISTKEAQMAKKQIALTPEQIAKYKAMRAASKTAPDSPQLKALKDQLKAEMGKKPADEKKIKELKKQIVEMQVVGKGEKKGTRKPNTALKPGQKPAKPGAKKGENAK